MLGPTRRGQQLLAFAPAWLPATEDLERADALARLARRYFSGHGPATAADLARWANITLADTRQAIAAARPALDSLSVERTEYLLAPETRDTLAGGRRQAEGVLALPHFDELLLGYRDRDPTLPPERDRNVFANRNGVPAPTIIHRGQVAATWKRPDKGSGAESGTPLVPLSERVLTAAGRAARISGRNPSSSQICPISGKYLGKMLENAETAAEWCLRI